MSYNAARGTHVSPGIYTKIVDLDTVTKTTGITTLGVTGETQIGPAFTPMAISDWSEFKTVFGGTNAELFKGSKYPKYELPYIAQSYLAQSNQLVVSRVLGFSGYNAGPAWLIKSVGTGEGDGMLVAVIRSRGEYFESLNGNTTTSCGADYSYDKLLYQVDPNNGATLEIYPAYDENYYTACGSGYYQNAIAKSDIISTADDFGTFILKGTKSNKYNNEAFSYTVSFNKGAKNYIYNVLGDISTDNDSPLFIEELYDVALDELINSTDSSNTITGISAGNQVTTLWASGTSYTVGQYVIYNSNSYKCKTAHISDATFDTTEASYWIAETDLFNHQLTLLNYKPIATSSGYTIYKPVISDLNILPQLLTKAQVGNRYLWSWKYFTETSFYEETGSVVNGKIVYGKKDFMIQIQGDWDATTSAPASATTVGYAWRVTNSGTTSLPSSGGSISNWTAGDLAIVDSYSTSGGTIWRKMITDGLIMKVVKDISESGVTSYNYHVSMQGYYNPTNTTFDNTFDGTFTGIASGLTYSAEQLTTVNDFVYNATEGVFYTYYTNAYVDRVIGDTNDYKEQYRYASTPWVVSEIKGSTAVGELIKLFRFHTITDGNSANTTVKISITNIKPDALTFNIIVRDYNDSDSNPVVLESYSNVNLNPNSKKYIGLVIGTSDGVYDAVSKYVTVEVTNNNNAAYSVPEGFLGYPIRDILQYVKQPLFQYNSTYDNTVKAKKQYFGVSDIMGVDNDMFTYKGKSTYTDGVLTHGFHLDSRITSTTTVDGVSGFSFDTVSASDYLEGFTTPPQLASENDATDTIYEDINVRKFTLVPYGGFDGWDIYRTQRTTSDAFKYGKYKGNLDTKTISGENFSSLTSVPQYSDIPEAAITTDYYAYLAGARVFANPSTIDINVFATPGIDYVSSPLLVNEIVSMIEDERQDSLYIVTTPDKASGAGDTIDDMFTADDAVSNLEGTDLDSIYVTTDYPWCKYYDSTNYKYIYLPVTRDVVANIALTDNTSYPWFPPSGKDNGKVNCDKAKYSTKLADEDTLYEGRINPVKTFANDGVYVWGQKNLYQPANGDANDSLTRLSTVRMILRLRKLIQNSCANLIFTPLDNTLVSKFTSIVTPILESIRTNRGITDYNIEVDDSTEARANMSLPAIIYIKPTNSLEYIDITFAITSQGTNLATLG